MGDPIKTGVPAHRTIYVFDLADAPKTGLVDADFTTQTVVKDGAVSALAITITEINAGTRPGAYDVAFTPDTDAEYSIRIAHPTYAVRGFIFEFTSTADGPLTLALIRAYLDANSTKLANLDATVSSRASAAMLTDVQTDVDELQTSVAAIGTAPTANQNADALLDRANAIDGKTPREAIRYIAATTVELSSGDPSGPVTFLGLDGVTKRVKSTMDASGNRIAVVLDPP